MQKRGTEPKPHPPQNTQGVRYYWIGILDEPLETGLLPPGGITETENGTFPAVTVVGTVNVTSQTPTWLEESCAEVNATPAPAMPTITVP